jgi:hypothetical protein
MFPRIGAPVWPPPFLLGRSQLFTLILIVSQISSTFAQDKLMGGLISTRDIAELTQIATQLAAQTMNSNGELL